jgi:hypothetical protein
MRTPSAGVVRAGRFSAPLPSMLERRMAVPATEHVYTESKEFLLVDGN